MLLNRHMDNFGAFGNRLLNERCLKVVLTTVSRKGKMSFGCSRVTTAEGGYCFVPHSR